jgi:hypothetical protein
MHRKGNEGRSKTHFLVGGFPFVGYEVKSKYDWVGIYKRLVTSIVLIQLAIPSSSILAFSISTF